MPMMGDKAFSMAPRVNIFDEAEAKYWAKRFSCTRAQLEAAVMKVGVMTKSVEKELKGK
jgi:hypothetical protein